MDWLKKLTEFAPAIAGAIATGGTGPLVAVALQKVAEHFGVEASEQEVAKAVQAASPEDLLKLKALDLEFQKLGLEEVKAGYADTASARQRDTAVSTSAEAPYLNKVIVPVLALLVVIGGGAIMVASQNADVRMAANSMVMIILGFYFGSTTGKVKDSQALRDALSK